MHNSICHDWAGGNINSQPDITIAVGNAQQAVKFMAHKFVLSSYSGYFKTLFASYDGAEAYISNIGSHTFAYLLSYMYTGHLELNPLNVYEIFAASSWLRMIDVLDLCQQYFVQKHHYTAALLQSSVVKPIPRRQVAVVSLHSQEPNRFLTYQPLRLHNESGSIFKPVRIEVNHQSQPSTIEERDSEEVDIIEGGDNSGDQNPPTTSTASENFKASSPSDKVVLDIACCDGPIKFHRVTNQFYNPEKAMTASAKEESASTCHKCNHTFSNELRERFGLSGCQFSNSGATNRHTSPSIPSTDSNADTKKKVENLQCYSCKTCGSKFPSYYFVHKHRKLHHQDTKEFLE